MKTESNFKFDANGIEITIVKKENYTLEDLKQKLINEFYSKPKSYYYEKNEIELLKLLFENEKY